MINILIESHKFLFWHGKKFWNQNCDISMENKQTKFHDFKSCVCQHTENFKKLNFVCLFSWKISQFWFQIFFPCQNRNLWLSIDILITYKYFFILAAELAKIKFLKSKKKPTLSDVLNFASLYFKVIVHTTVQ